MKSSVSPALMTIDSMFSSAVAWRSTLEASRPRPLWRDEGADAIAHSRLVFERGGDAVRAILRSHKAACDGVLAVVAGMAAAGRELRPAELRIGPVGPALPGAAVEIRERGEALERLRVLVPFAIAILPRARRVALRGRRRFRLHEGERRCQLRLARFALKQAARRAGARARRHRRARVARLRATATCARWATNAIVQIEERLLRHDGVGALRDGEVGIREIEGAQHGRQPLAIDRAVERAARSPASRSPGLPPTFRSSSPVAASHASRISSKVSRCVFMRQSRRFAGSSSRAFASAAASLGAVELC